MTQTTVGPHLGHASGDTDIEKTASQLVSDIKYKVGLDLKKKGGASHMNPAQVAQMYMLKLKASSAPGQVKAIAIKKLTGGLKEEYEVSELVEESIINAFAKVFIDGIGKKSEDVDVQEDANSSGEREFHIRVTDKKTGNIYTRDATRTEISELRANPNISSVEMTEYDLDSDKEKYKGENTAKVKSGQGLDPVGKEDSDVNNNRVNNDPSDKYLLKRRAAIRGEIQNRKTISASYESDNKIIDEANKQKKIKKAITGDRVNNYKNINLKPTLEQTEVNPSIQNQVGGDDKEKTKTNNRIRTMELKILLQKINALRSAPSGSDPSISA